MKKILVYYSYSQKNAGDMAICLGLLDLLSELNNCEIVMVSRYAEKDKLFHESKAMIEKYHPTIIVKPGYVNFDRNGGFFSKLKAYFRGFFLSLFPSNSKRLRQDIKDSDLILFNGGNYLRSNSLADKIRLKALFFPIKYAVNHGKKIICMPQSTAKAKNKKSLKALRKICSLFSHIFIRDPISYSYFIDNNICDSNKVSMSCDLAFFTKNIKAKPEINHPDSPSTKHVAINARVTGIGDIGFISNDKISAISKTYLKLIHDNSDCHFTFVCQTEKDLPNMEKLFDDAVKSGFSNISFFKSNDPYELKNVYSNHSLLISMRLHASILAISSGTPVIGFTFREWGFKNEGILNQFGFNNCTTFDKINDEFQKVLLTKMDNDPISLIETKKKDILYVLNQYIS